jgi:hypothetical protein
VPGIGTIGTSQTAMATVPAVAFLCSELSYQINKCLIRLPFYLRVQEDVANIISKANLSAHLFFSQKTFSQWAEGNETNA